MSLADFSSTMQARIKYLSDNALSGELKAWSKSLEASYGTDIGLKSDSKETLRNSASLLLIDKQGAFGSVSKFRQKGGNTSNNIVVVTEENLKNQFKYYDLPIPVIDGKKVYPGEAYYVDPTTGDVDTSKPMGLIVAYITWLNQHSKSNKKIEYYTNSSKTVSRSKALRNQSELVAVRQYGIKHADTSKRLYSFLTACGLRIPFETYAQDWQIGHIESQSHGRLIITKNARSSAKYDNGFIDKLMSLNKYLDLASSSLQPQYTKLTADILKSFRGTDIFMNVEMQPTGKGPVNKRDPLSNQGSGDLSRALGFVAILRDIGSSSEGKAEGDIRSISVDVDNIASKLNQLYKNYNKNKKTVAQALSNFKGMPKNFLIDLESSDTIRTFIKKTLIGTLDNKAAKPVPLKVNHKNVPVINIDTSDSARINNEIKQLSSKVKSSLQKLKTTKSAKKSASGPALNIKTEKSLSVVDLISLQNLLNNTLVQQVKQNMGGGDRRDILNLRSGRFAESVKVERLSESRAGMITAFYSYMKNPYATFSTGGLQSNPQTRDPKLLIAKSIRELAAQQVQNRLRSVVV